MFPTELSRGDALFVLVFIVAVIAFAVLAHFLPKQDLGPDPDYPTKEDTK